MINLTFVLATSPFILFLALLLGRKMPLLKVSLFTLVYTVFLALLYWKVVPIYLAGSLIKGFLVAFDIFIIIFGAIFFLEIMKATKIMDNVGFYLESISKDLRVQVILLAWFFENFLEGTAGFGTPSTVVAPILVSLGISPINAVIIALLGNSASVVFGAAGTPIKVGFGALAGGTLPLRAAFLNGVGMLVPVFILWFLTKNKLNPKKEFFEALPFAIWSGFVFSAASIASVFLGQEFPSILGAVIGLGIVLVTLKIGIFIPKHEKDEVDIPRKPTLPLSEVIFPYFLLVVILIIGKFLVGSAGFQIPLIIKHTFAFFNPGFAFIVTGLITILFFRSEKIKVFSIIKLSTKRSIEPFLVIAFMSGLAQLMVNSSTNHLGLPSMIASVSIYIKNTYLALVAPFIGAFGSFLTGSATVSNLMFGNILYASAKEIGLNVDKILALLLVGGAAGNMIALADIVAAETVVGLKGRERNVLKGVLVPCLIYVTLVGIIGYLITC